VQIRFENGIIELQSQDNSSRYSDWLWAGLRGRSLSLSRVKNFLFSKSSRPALGSTQPPIQWVLGPLSLGVKLIPHLQLVPRLRKCGPIHPLLHMLSWCSA
jgi:hypothetical protein